MLSDGIGSGHERCLLLVSILRSKRGAVGRDRLADHASLDRGPPSGRSEQGWTSGRQVERDRRGPCERHGGHSSQASGSGETSRPPVGVVAASRRPVGALRVEGEGWAIGGHHEQRRERFDRGGCVRNREGGCWSPFTDPRDRHPREHGDREHQHGAFVPKGGPAHAMSLGSRHGRRKVPRAGATPRPACYPSRILFFWLWNSSSVSTPLFRSSARRSSSPVVEADAGGKVAWAGAGSRPPPRYMRSLLSSPW